MLPLASIHAGTHTQTTYGNLKIQSTNVVPKKLAQGNFIFCINLWNTCLNNTSVRNGHTPSIPELRRQRQADPWLRNEFQAS